MYDLLNTQAHLSRQKEHLQLPKRHTLHPAAWLIRVLCVKRCWVFLALTETLGSWGGSELADVQSIAEDVQHLRVLGTLYQTLGDAIFLPGSPKKYGFIFPMLSGSSFNILLCPCCSLAVCCGGKPEPDKKYPMSPSALRAPTAVLSAGAVQWSAPFC